MITEATEDKIKQVPLLDVIGHYVKLKRQGANHVGLCPFHNDSSASLTVSPSKNIYKCFACGKGGAGGVDFVMAHTGCTYPQALEAIAKNHNITIEYVKKDLSKDDRDAIARRRDVKDAITKLQKYYADQLRLGTSDEARAARQYAYARWGEELCESAGIGFAPADRSGLDRYITAAGIKGESLLSAGMYRKADSGQAYPFFKGRITIPIRTASGTIIAYTARHIGPDKSAEGKTIPKYLNNSDTELFKKGDTIFGLEQIARLGKPVYVNVVEGAPDVLALQRIGIANTVATLGTGWTPSQFETIKKYTSSLCFIPDADPPKPGEHYGPGTKAVMRNGAEAVKAGLDVTVRELPFGQDEEGNPTKHDADSYITDRSVYESLEEKNFIVWYAEKQFALLKSMAETRKLIEELADLLRLTADQAVVDHCVAQLSTIHGKAKLWREAIARAKGIARQKEYEQPGQSRQSRKSDAELLRMFNLSIRENCYYTYEGEDDGATRLSNFILEPLYHIMDEANGTRIFKIINTYGQEADIEFKESELCSLAAFTQRVGSMGNYVWRAKADKLNNVKEFVYARTDSAQRLKKMGWDAATDSFVFGNGIFTAGTFHQVDDLGIARPGNGKAYYIPACSKMYRHNAEIYQFERLMVHNNRSGLRLHDYAKSLCNAFGEQARIAFCYLLATIFRDIIYRRTSHFPILNLFGEKGTGKTTLALCLQSWFMTLIDPPSLGTTTIPAMNDRASQAVNVLAIFDEYKNDLDPRKIFFLKGLWGGGGQTKKNAATDGMAAQTMITNGVALCGQDKPTQDMALFTRLIYLAFNRTSFTQQERVDFDAFYSQCKLGLSHLTLQVLQHRATFEKNFNDAYSLTKSELADRIKDEEVHDRIFGNWVIPLAAFRVLETHIDAPFSYAELFESAVKGLKHQNDYAKESSETAGFWSALQGYQTAGKCVERAHYRIKWHAAFRPIGVGEDIVFTQPRPVLYLNAPAIESLINGRVTNATNNRSNWSTTLSYLKSHPSFLGLKQDRFIILNPQGSPDFTVELVAGQQVKKHRYNRPKALCFDYEALKEAFGIDLETSVLTEEEETREPEQPNDTTLPF